MKKIFKYKLPVDGGVVTINADVVEWLDVKTQNGWPHIWAIVDEGSRANSREFEIVAWGTGWDVPEELMNCGYLGTAVDGAGYVWHYFYQEVTPAYATIPADYYDYSTLSVTGKAPDVQPYTITISCGEADSAVSATRVNDPLEGHTTGTVSSNVYTKQSYNIESLLDKLTSATGTTNQAYAH